jgi:peptidoglycan/LPS O-acetylase OafA/YrhL
VCQCVASIWAALSLTNVHHTLVSTDYFQASSFPLLHVWSLAVEEQFYLMWPLLFMWMSRKLKRRARATTIVLLIVVSLTTAELSPSYYLLHTRAFELLLGSLLALAQLEPIANIWLRHGLSVLGFVLVCVSLILVTDTATIPGFVVLPCCVGTMMLLSTDGAMYESSSHVVRLLLLTLTHTHLNYTARAAFFKSQHW